MTEFAPLPPWPVLTSGMTGAPIAKRAADIGVGSVAFHYSESNRVYRRTMDGKAVGGPIGRYYWQPILVHGETRVSWLAGIGRLTKFPKKPQQYAPQLIGLDDVEDRIWSSRARAKLPDAIRDCEDIAVIREICRLLNVEVKP